MSWIYWGIVTGLAAMVLTLLISMDIYFSKPNEPEKKLPGDPSNLDQKAGSSAKHAA